MFQREITEKMGPPPKPEEKPLPDGESRCQILQKSSLHELIPTGEHTRDFEQTEVTLFRFSALTFNAHKIHYSHEWCRKVEGHRDCVVHGPLNLLNILDLYRDTNAQGKPESVPKAIAYRAMSPLYVGEKYRIMLDKTSSTEEDRGQWNADITDSFGKTSVKATITE